jgi:predicted ArsR family transcriptional regulator
MGDVIKATRATPPAGSITTSEFAKKLNISDTAARKRLEQYIDAEEMESAKFHAQGRGGSWKTYFWWKKTAK